jgi:hypothetical protein
MKINIKNQLIFCGILFSALFFGIFCFAQKVNATTTVSGIIDKDTTWTQENSPYIVTGNILIKENVTLTIEPGVTVKFERHPEYPFKGYYIWVDGTLVARGTSEQMITFTSNSSNPLPGDWATIYFSPTSTDWDEASSTGSIIEYAIIEYGGNYMGGPYESNSLISIIDSSPLIKNSILRLSKIDFLIVKGGSPKIINNKFQGGERGNGRILVFEGSPYFSENEITRSDGFYIVGGAPIITKNNILANGRDIYSGGIRIQSGAPEITYNNIINNSKNGIAIILPYGGNCSTKIHNNNIFGNEKFSIFLSNTTADIDATNNWWGTTSTTSIEELIYDQKDDFNLGKVNYEPFLTEPASGTLPIDIIPPSPPTNATHTPISCGDKNVGISWSNPSDEDLFSIRIYRSETKDELGKLIWESDGVPYKGFVWYPYYGEGFDEIELDKPYYYTIKAVDVWGNESSGTQIEIMVPSCENIPPPPDTTPPSLPTNVKVENISTENELKLKISWTNPSDKDLAGFRLYRSDQYAIDYSIWNGGILSKLKNIPENQNAIICDENDNCYISPNATSIVDNYNLQNGIKYYYFLQPFDTSGNSPGLKKDFIVSGIPQYPSTSGIQINSIIWIKNFALPDNTYLNGWKIKFEITVNNPEETQLQFKLADWTSGANKISTINNTKISLIDLKSETEIASATNVGTEYEHMTPLTLVDRDPNTPGIQAEFYLWVKIPTNTPAGIYTTFYGIRTQKP